MQQEVGCNSDASFWGKCSKKRKCTSCCAMSGRPIMIRRVGIAWLVSPWQDLHPHDAGEDRCGQKTKWARSKIGQTRCLLLWISDSPFRITDGGSCSISLVVNQSLTHTPWPRTSLPSQWLSRRALHIVYTQPENMFCLGTRNIPPFKDWVIYISSDARLPEFAPPDVISRTSYFCQVNSSGCIGRLFLIQGGGAVCICWQAQPTHMRWIFWRGGRIHGLAF